MPTINSEDTIAAIATPIGEGGISVMRISGPKAFALVKPIFVSKKEINIELAPSHTLHYGEIRDLNGKIIDQVILSLFRAPHSYTGEDVIEISAHGGLFISRHILDLLLRCGARHAEAGEFTKRAFLNGKMDLTQAEAVLDLIRAKSDLSAQAAMHQLTGSLSHKFKTLKDQLMKMYAHMEAFLDFPDEHLEIYEDQQFESAYQAVEKELQQLIDSFQRGALMREGIVLAIIGRPNVGKSSLFNMLLARDRALVSEFPGTTRDRIEEGIQIGGHFIRLIDTAGLRAHSNDPVERMGMERTRQAMAEAHIYMIVVDSSEPMDDADREIFKALAESQNMTFEKPVLILMNKIDLAPKIDTQELKNLASGNAILNLSTKTKAGIEQLEKALEKILLSHKLEVAGEQITRLRHKDALEKALAALKRSYQAFQEKKSLEFVIEDLKLGLNEIRELIGEIYSEDLLDVIFSEFCIGK